MAGKKEPSLVTQNCLYLQQRDFDRPIVESPFGKSNACLKNIHQAGEGFSKLR
jgi:hypothetical protein